VSFFFLVCLLAVSEKSKIKNLGDATPDIVIPQNFVIFNSAMYAKLEWLGGCADRNAQ
jgi:hypothetical protein